MCAGATFKKHEATGKAVDVSGFHNSLNTMKNIEVVTAITAIDINSDTIIGVFNKSLWFEETMKHSLMPPIQLWDYGITVDPVLKQYSDGKSLHGIYSYHDDVLIPFHMKRLMSYFSSRLPTEEEKRSSRWVVFTSNKE